MTTAFRRKQSLREINDDAARRQIAEGVSRWHAQDVKNVEPRRWVTENQMLCAVALAFLAGFGACYALLYVLSMGE